MVFPLQELGWKSQFSTCGRQKIPYKDFAFCNKFSNLQYKKSFTKGNSGARLVASAISCALEITVKNVTRLFLPALLVCLSASAFAAKATSGPGDPSPIGHDSITFGPGDPSPIGHDIAAYGPGDPSPIGHDSIASGPGDPSPIGHD
jgi:hypothetical protein